MLKYCGHLFLFSLLFCVIIWLSSCAPKYQIEPPGLTFSHVRPIQLNISQIQVTNTYVPPLKKPQVEHLMPTPLYIALERLATKMFTVGQVNDGYVLNIVIEKASVQHKKLPEPKSIFMKWGSYPDDQYDFDVRIGYILKDIAGHTLSDGYVQVTGEKTLQSDISPVGRDMVFVKMAEHVGMLLERETRKLFQQKFPQIYLN